MIFDLLKVRDFYVETDWQLTCLAHYPTLEARVPGTWTAEIGKVVPTARRRDHLG